MKSIISELMKNSNKSMKLLLKEIRKKSDDRISRLNLNELSSIFFAEICEYDNAIIFKDLWSKDTVKRYKELYDDVTDFELSMNNFRIHTIFANKVVDALDMLIVGLLIMQSLNYKLSVQFPNDVFIIDLGFAMKGKPELRNAIIHFYRESIVSPKNVFSDLEGYENEAGGYIIVNEHLFKNKKN